MSDSAHHITIVPHSEEKIAKTSIPGSFSKKKEIGPDRCKYNYRVF